MQPNYTTQPQPPLDQPDQKKLHPMVVLRPGEQVVCEIKRHPFGILSMYFSGALAIIVTAVLAVFAPTIFGDTFGNIQTMAYLAVGIITVGVIAVLFLATSIYWQNRWIVTDDSITQITQNGLFGRRVSQLSMESLEDVTVDQHGLLQSMFGFGTLHAETANERSKFVFQYCPQPNKYARQILQAHEMFLHQTRHQPQAVLPVDDPQSQAPSQSTSQYAQPQSYQIPTQQQQNPPTPYGYPPATAQVPPTAPQPQYAAQPPAQPLQPHLPQQGMGQPAQDEPGRSRPAIWGK